MSMTRFARPGCAGALFAVGLFGTGLTAGSCASAPPIPLPSPSPTPAPSEVGELAVFDDPDSDFTTTDVYDIDGDIVQFDIDRNVLIWKATGREYTSWQVQEYDLVGNGRYRVRFGSEGGVQRAYWTEVGPATVCDLRIGELFGSLLIFATTNPVPQN